jgi:magnesium transporter
MLDLHASVLTCVQRDPVTLTPAQSVGDALKTLRARGTQTDVLYLYVVEEDGRLVGVVPTRALLSAGPETVLADIMLPDVVAIPDWATVLIAAEYFVSKKFLAFPVVNSDGILLGQVDVSVFTDEVISHARRSFDDIFQIIGVHATQGRTAWTGFLDRFPWLLTNVAGGLITARIASRYEGLLDVVVVLALFIPVVLALAESVSIQSVTLTLQGLHSSGASWALVGPALRREFLTAGLLGLGCGSLVGGIAGVWKGSLALALAVGGAITASMITAALLGMLLPTLLHAARRDPKIAAGPIVLASADLCTLLIYFNLAGQLV